MNVTSNRVGPTTCLKIDGIPHLLIDLSHVVAIQSWVQDKLPEYVIEVYGIHGTIFCSEYEDKNTWILVLEHLQSLFRNWGLVNDVDNT